jgi:hypothetical protein
LLRIFLDSEDGDEIFLRNIDFQPTTRLYITEKRRKGKIRLHTVTSALMLAADRIITVASFMGRKTFSVLLVSV